MVGKPKNIAPLSATRSKMHALPLAVGTLADALRSSGDGALVGPKDVAGKGGPLHTASLVGSDVSHAVETEVCAVPYSCMACECNNNDDNNNSG